MENKLNRELNYNLIRKDKTFRYEVYRKVLDYYYSRINENELLQDKPWYYRAVLLCLDLKPRYRTYDPVSSNIRFTQVLTKLYPDTVHIGTMTYMKFYFPEIYDNRYISEKYFLFTKDYQRIAVLEKLLLKDN